MIFLCNMTVFLLMGFLCQYFSLVLAASMRDAPASAINRGLLVSSSLHWMALFLCLVVLANIFFNRKAYPLKKIWPLLILSIVLFIFLGVAA